MSGRPGISHRCSHCGAYSEGLPARTLFVATVISQNGCFLLVHENGPEASWYLPAGGVEPGETLEQAARRECREEAGVQAQIGRLLKVEQRWRGKLPWLRFIFEGSVNATSPLKDHADLHSRGAAWINLDQVADLCQRAPDLPELLGLANR